MRIALTGGAGQLGRSIQTVLGAEHEVVSWDLGEVDVTDAEKVMDAVMALRPDAIVHAAALTDVDACERDPAMAIAVHVDGTKFVAQAARRARAHLVAISTDYVFDGAADRPYTEDDEPNPLQVYGRTKLDGERHALEVAPRCTVVRSAWLYDLEQPQGFAAAVLRQAATGQPFRVVADQVGSPTSTRWLTARIAEILATRTMGLLHRVEPVIESRADHARRLLAHAGFDTALVADARTEDLPSRPASRPAYSALASIRDLRAPEQVAHNDGCDC